MKLQSRVSWSVPAVKHAKPESFEGDWEYPENPSDFAFWKEKCYIKVQNFREAEGVAPVEEAKPLDKRTQA
jgi:hypothetical protein